MSFELEQRTKALEAYLTQIAHSTGDAQIDSYLCRLGSVLICGYIERSLEIIIAAKFAKNCPKQIPSFLKSFFARGKNYKCSQISELLYQFDAKWGGDFDEFIKNNQKLKESINSCYGLRNNIAHGGGQNASIEPLIQYSNDAVALVGALAVIVNI